MLKGYVRVSTDKQEESPEAQREALQRYAEYHRESIEIFTDLAVSGKTPIEEREQGKRLSDGLKDGDTVVVTKLDRLFRSLADAAGIIPKWTERGIRMVILNMGGSAVDTMSSTGRLFLNMMCCVGQWEREAISERTRDVLRHIKKNGRARTNLRPFGFRLGDKRTLIVDPVEAQQLSEFMKLRHAGWSIENIVSEANMRGVLTPQGKPWGKSSMWRVLREEETRRKARAVSAR